MKYITFILLCERLGPCSKNEDTCFRVNVLMQEIVAMLLCRLGSDDGLQNTGH